MGRAKRHGADGGPGFGGGAGLPAGPACPGRPPSFQAAAAEDSPRRLRARRTWLRYKG